MSLPKEGYCHTYNGTEIETQLLLLDMELYYHNTGMDGPDAEEGTAPWYLLHDGRTINAPMHGQVSWTVSFTSPEKALEWAVTYRGKKHEQV